MIEVKKLSNISSEKQCLVLFLFNEQIKNDILKSEMINDPRFIFIHNDTQKVWDNLLNKKIIIFTADDSSEKLFEFKENEIESIVIVTEKDDFKKFISFFDKDSHFIRVDISVVSNSNDFVEIFNTKYFELNRKGKFNVIKCKRIYKTDDKRRARDEDEGEKYTPFLGDLFSIANGDTLLIGFNGITNEAIITNEHYYEENPKELVEVTESNNEDIQDFYKVKCEIKALKKELNEISFGFNVFISNLYDKERSIINKIGNIQEPPKKDDKDYEPIKSNLSKNQFIDIVNDFTKIGINAKKSSDDSIGSLELTSYIGEKYFFPMDAPVLYHDEIKILEIERFYSEENFEKDENYNLHKKHNLLKENFVNTINSFDFSKLKDTGINRLYIPNNTYDLKKMGENMPYIETIKFYMVEGVINDKTLFDLRYFKNLKNLVVGSECIFKDFKWISETTIKHLITNHDTKVESFEGFFTSADKNNEILLDEILYFFYYGIKNSKFKISLKPISEWLIYLRNTNWRTDNTWGMGSSNEVKVMSIIFAVLTDKQDFFNSIEQKSKLISELPENFKKYLNEQLLILRD